MNRLKLAKELVAISRGIIALERTAKTITLDELEKVLSEAGWKTNDFKASMVNVIREADRADVRVMKAVEAEKVITSILKKKGFKEPSLLKALAYLVMRIMLGDVPVAVISGMRLGGSGKPSVIEDDIREIENVTSRAMQLLDTGDIGDAMTQARVLGDMIGRAAVEYADGEASMESDEEHWRRVVDEKGGELLGPVHTALDKLVKKRVSRGMDTDEITADVQPGEFIVELTGSYRDAVGGW